MPYNVTVERLPIFALFDLKGPGNALSDWCNGLWDFQSDPNSRTRSETAELFHIGPGKWVLHSGLEHEEKLTEQLRPDSAPPDISIVRVSDTLTFFRITGADATQVISIGCPLDLHPEIYHTDSVAYSDFFGVKALILRVEGGFEIGIEQSFGDMIADYLSRAMA